MGTWGTGIFDDDTAADVRDNYRDLITDGVDDAEALARMQAEFLEAEPSIRPAIEPLFWLALARAQWEIGRLDELTKARAIGVIDSGAEIERWRSLDASESDLSKRSKVLAGLRTLLESPQKPRKKLRAPKKRVSPYQVGDVVSFRLGTGRFVLFRVTSVMKNRGDESPIAEVLDWIGTSFPTAVELAALPGRPRIKARDGASIRYPRILLKNFPGMKFDDGRFAIIARGLPMPVVTSEGFSAYPFDFLEQALADEFGLK